MNTNVFSSKILRDYLNALHSARKAFIESENSERIKRALNHNNRSSGDTKYMTGDVVFYKRNDSQLWKGPGTVIGQDGQQILIKHGSTYVRVHPCRIQLKHNELQVNSSPNSNTTTQGKENCTAQTNQCSETYIQSDSESDTNETNSGQIAILNDQSENNQPESEDSSTELIEINHSEISPSTMKSPDATEISNNYPGEASNTTTNNIDDMTTDERKKCLKQISMMQITPWKQANIRKQPYRTLKEMKQTAS